MQITDRAKDVIKSGGEWLSTIEIENLAAGHPKALIAAVIGVAHPKWDERPLLLVKLRDGESAKQERSSSQYLDGKIARWWMPDDVVFVDDDIRWARPARSTEADPPAHGRLCAADGEGGGGSQSGQNISGTTLSRLAFV